MLLQPTVDMEWIRSIIIWWPFVIMEKIAFYKLSGAKLRPTWLYKLLECKTLDLIYVDITLAGREMT